MKRPERLPWTYLLLESSLIVLSVLLAFAIGEWRQGRADEALASRVLETIRREVTANQAELEEALANHQEVLQRLASGSDEPLGIRPAVLRNSAWSTAQATGATVQLPYEMTELAAELHELQSLHRTAQVMAFEQLAMVELNETRIPPGEVRSIRSSMWAPLVGLESRLLEEYDRALRVLGEAETDR